MLNSSPEHLTINVILFWWKVSVNMVLYLYLCFQITAFLTRLDGINSNQILQWIFCLYKHTQTVYHVHSLAASKYHLHFELCKWSSELHEAVPGSLIRWQRPEKERLPDWFQAPHVSAKGAEEINLELSHEKKNINCLSFCLSEEIRPSEMCCTEDLQCKRCRHVRALSYLLCSICHILLSQCTLPT